MIHTIFSLFTWDEYLKKGALRAYKEDTFKVTRTPGRSAPIFSSVSLRSMNGSNLKLKH